MPRKTVGISKGDDNFDYEPLINPGITMLKFGRGGTPHERLFRLSGDLRYLTWSAGWFCSKLGGQCHVDLEKVSRIMQGQNTFQFQRWSSVYGDASDKSFSIVYLNKNNKERTLDLISPSPEIFKLWFGGLKSLVKKLQEQRQNYSLDTLYLKSLWDRADDDHSGSLSSKEVIQLIQAVNINMQVEKIRQLYKKFDTDQSGTLDFQEFVQFMAFLRKRRDLESIWHTIVSGESFSRPIDHLAIDTAETDKNPSVDAVISLDQFVAFWKDMQGEVLTTAEAKDLINFCNAKTGAAAAAADAQIKSHTGGVLALKNRPPADAAPEHAGDVDDAYFLISYSMFSNVMTNHAKVSLFDPLKARPYQDMTKPLSCYYMASSHNTYLEGDQLTSFSSVNRYVNDLLSGCRCVELDCWDGDNGVPMICHGHTMTGKILFKDVIKAIMEYGFVTSEYPVVLSIENHCSFDQQRTLAKIMVDTFKDCLALPMKNADGTTRLPSPAELRRKILIKGKRAAAPSAAAASAGGENEEDVDEEEEEEEEEEDSNVPPTGASAKGKSSRGSGDKAAAAAAAAGGDSKNKKKKEKASKTHPDLSAITYLGTGKVKHFSEQISATIPCDMMCSYSEITTNKYIKDDAKVAGWIHHNKAHLSRIYPKGTRIDSSNYMPVSAWAAGNQLVALNYQTGDLPYHVNFGKFLENGKCGYVLKPEHMLTDDPALKGVQAPGIRLIINVISATSLPKPGGAQKGEIIDPFVLIYINGPYATDNDEAKTRTINDNGFNPLWNQTFSFDIRYPDLTYITFHVNDEDVISHDFIAFASMPVNCMRQGLRTVKLFNVMGKADQDFEYASLFVRVTMEPLP